MHLTLLAFSFALDNAGNSKDARIAMIAITTSNSMSVNPRLRLSDKPMGRVPSTGDRLSGNQLINAVLSHLFRFFKCNMRAGYPELRAADSVKLTVLPAS